MARIKIEQPIARVEDSYPTPDVAGIKPDLKDVPEMKAVGMCKKNGQWLSFEITFKNKVINKIDYGEPNIRLIAQSEFKTKCVKLWDNLMLDE